jgi:signal transduction histidine kinase
VRGRAHAVKSSRVERIHTVTLAGARTLGKVADLATGAGDPRADMESIAREIAHLYRAAMVSVFLQYNGFGPKHVTGYAVSPLFLRTLDQFGDAWGTLLSTDAHEPIVLNNVPIEGPTDEICQWAATTGITTVALAPISINGRPFGALVLCHREPYEYGEEDRLILRALAGLAAPVISRARLGGDTEGPNSALFNVLGHELRTPLTAIMGFTQMIRKRLAVIAPGDARLLEHVDVLWVQSQRLNRLIDSFVDLGRIERGDFQISPARFELTGLLRSIALQTLNQAGSRHRLEMNLARRPVWLNGDERRLEQVISHLLANAAKYSPSDMPIELTCDADYEFGEAFVRITDRGPGISSTRVKEVFQERNLMVPLKAGGLGVGLYLSKVIVEAHGGRITLDTSQAGTAVTITLPI